MGRAIPTDWNIRDEKVQDDQRSAFDRMRSWCPVARGEDGHWTVFRHADVRRILLDHVGFSNRVSEHVSVPNGMDLPQHTSFRRLIEPFFSAARVAAFQPRCRGIADELAAALPGQGETELMAGFAMPFALRAQCAFMGWPQQLELPLHDWLQRSQQASFVQDRAVLAGLAAEFAILMGEQLRQRREENWPATSDITCELMQGQVDGRALADEEIISILRNWTVGEVGTLAASIGILAHYLAQHPELQQQLRSQPDRLYYANDEILRMHNPLLENRRRTTCPVQLGGRQIDAGERVTLNWVAANRDPEVFPEPDSFSWQRNPLDNLLYGDGIHVCPGAPMARMELVEVMASLLQHCFSLQPAAGKQVVPARYPSSGYAQVWLML